ncbi:MAG: tetratricopeptide repeat protein [Candidatus Eiseniibacteriota bacterium]
MSGAGRRAAAAALLGVLACSGTLGAGWVYDDWTYVAGNGDLSGDLSRIPRLFAVSFPSNAPERGLYRPLTAATYALERGGGPADPVRSHVVNLLLAAAATMAAHAVLRRLVDPAAALAGTFLFAVHPVHVEAVAWVTGRSELLAGLFALASVAWGLDVLRGGGVLRAAGAGACALLGLLSKESAAVALPLLGAAAALAPSVRLDRLPLALGSVAGGTLAGLALRTAALGAFAPAAGERVGAADLPGRLPLIVAAAGEHLRLLAWPWPLTVERMPEPPAAWSDAVVVSGLAVLLAGSVLAFALRRRRSALLLVCWAPVALLPVLHLVPIGETVAERFLFLPSLGACGVAGVALASPGRGRALRRGVLVALVALGWALSFARAGAWRSETALWTDATRRVPESAGVWAGLADATAHAGRPGDAIPHYRAALRRDPGLTVARLGLAQALEETGRTEEALAETERAVLADPGHAPALNNLGVRLARVGRGEEAREMFRRAVEAAPTYAPALRNAALAAWEIGREDEAAELLARAKTADPALPDLAELEANLQARSFRAPPADR